MNAVWVRFKFLSLFLYCASVATAQPASPPNPDVESRNPSAEDVDEAIKFAVDTLDRITAETSATQRTALLTQVRDAITRVQATDADHPWLTYLLGRTFIVEGRRRDAITQLERFVQTRVGRNEWRSLRLLGDLFVDEFPRLAQQHYRRAAELKIDDPGVLFGLSRSAHKLGDHDKAIRLARQAVDVDGRSTMEYLAHLARLAAPRGEWDDALAAAEAAVSLAERAVREKPGQAAALAMAGSQYQLLIEVEEARVRTLRDATGIADGCLRLVEVISRQADMLSRLARHDALRILRTAVERTQPHAPVALLESYGMTLAEVGQTEEAIGVFERIIADDSNNSLAVSWLERLRRGQADRTSAGP